ncbi:MAG: hypothetical protein E7386_10465 [Ruminococcaceae bacterium]|nr:hypothetical protein [Oscillospiraceae bacterium]
MKRIFLDLSGGDNPASVISEGAFRALEKNSDLHVTFVGSKKEYEEVFASHADLKERFDLIPCDEILTNEDNPMLAAKPGAGYTMSVALENLSKCEDTSAVVSVGNTGALIIASVMKIGLEKGCKRPVLAALLPYGIEDRVCLVDCGSSLEPTPEEMLSFGVLGSKLMESRGIANPKVALMNVGREDCKGTESMVSAFKLLKESGLNFIGNIEPDNLLTGETDVAVSTGLVGNALLKGNESAGNLVADSIMKGLKERLSGDSLKAAMEVLEETKCLYQYNEYGGAVILGIRKHIVKAHGKADANTIYSCINQAIKSI